MKLSEELYEEELRKFSISTFSDLIIKSSTLDLPNGLFGNLTLLENDVVKKFCRRYNMVTMILALKSHLSSSACYKQLNVMDCISLPHDSLLRRLYSSFGLDTEFLPFLKTETSWFNQFERHLSLNIDEIHPTLVIKVYLYVTFLHTSYHYIT